MVATSSATGGSPAYGTPVMTALSTIGGMVRRRRPVRADSTLDPSRSMPCRISRPLPGRVHVRAARTGLATVLLLLALLLPAARTAAAGATVLRARLSANGLAGGATVVLGSGTTATAAVLVDRLTPRWWLVATVQTGTCNAPGPVLAMLKGIAPANGVLRLWARVPATHVAALRSAAAAKRLSVTVRNDGRTACAALGAGPVGSPPASGVPDFAHVYVIVMENRSYAEIVGNSSAPYLNGLLAHHASLTNMHGVTHPSEPNYIALFSGSTHGVTSDGVYNLAAQNLADQLEAHGKTWAVFAQNVPSGCYTGATASGGADGSGTYARKHEPAISFSDISTNPSRCAHILDFTHFSPSAADFELIIPNLCNDMHDCSTATGDRFLAAFVPRIIDSPAFARSVLFITWDEGTSDAGGGGRVATAVISPLVQPGTVDPQLLNHYALLRTIEDGWRLGCLANACSAPNLARVFGG